MDLFGRVINHKLFFPLLVSAVLLLTAYTSYGKTQEKYEQIVDRVDELEERVSFEFAVSSTHLQELAESFELTSYVNDRSANNKRLVELLFTDVLESEENYHHVRFIDNQGKEAVRVNREGENLSVVPFSKLQDKSDRYYFMDTMKLDEGEIYVSPLDLNIENKVIAKPITPTLRIATPIFGSSGEKEGILIINYLANNVIGDFAKYDESLQNATLLLVNSDGEFFKGLRPGDAWSFMYPGGEDRNFRNQLPSGWNKIKKNDSGVAYTREGVFIYTKIFPIQVVQGLQDEGGREFSYFTKYLSVRDFHLVISSYSTFPEVANFVFYDVILQPYVVYGYGLIVIFLIWRVLHKMLLRDLRNKK